MTDPNDLSPSGDADRPKHCPLCRRTGAKHFFADRNRPYLKCAHCRMVFVPDRFRLDAEAEKAVYDRHENVPDDPGYRRFLSRLTVPLLQRLEPGSRGLDFGCGPGPALPVMLAKQGHCMDRYDPFFFSDRSIFNKCYDFICATEVVEHLYDPDRELTTLFTMLKPGGWLGIMTKLVIDRDAFSTWHYIRDPTHVCFFSRETFAYLAQRFEAACDVVDKDVILMRKPHRCITK